MNFKIDNISNAVLYDSDHNPIMHLNDIEAVSIDDVKIDGTKKPKDKERIHLISKFTDDLTFEMTGFYCDKDVEMES